MKDDSSLVKFENAMEYIEDSKYSKAIDELEFLLLIDPLSEYSSKAQYFLAESYYNLENYDKAIIEFEKYLSRRSLSNDLLKKTQLYLCKCYYNVTLDYNKDPSSTYIAIEKLQYFIEKESMSENINEIENMILKLRTKLAKKNFKTAKLYIRLEEFDSAAIYYNTVIKEYYDTKFVDDSLINVAIIYFLESKQKSISYLENQKRNFSSNSDYEEAIAFISNLKSKQKVEYYINQLK
tara:strand:- start:12 stop:722 length:711 start_codon:yes stop_codon:yes gene_type:complete